MAILPIAFKKSCKPLFLFVFAENVCPIFSENSLAPSLIFSDASFAAFLTLSETFVNSSRIFFSILSIFTGSPSICNFSAVVFASGNKIQSAMYTRNPAPTPAMVITKKSKRTQMVSILK